MASCPPLPVEDQTDEDFFDKLVDDDYAGAASGPGFVEGSESDEVKALANLSLGEVLSGADDSMGETKEEEINPCVNGELAGLDANEGKSIASPNSSGIDNVIQSKNDATAVDDTPVPIRDQSGGASASGVKELQWSSFNTDTGWRGPGGFGSYSDFFTQLEDRAQDIPGEVEDSFKGEAKVSSGSGELKNDVFTNLPNYDQYPGGQGYVAGADNNENLQESSSNENWDNLYPGWKYDPNTCQWYQVDDLSAIENVQESFNFNSTGAWPGSDGNLDASYTRQTVQSVAGTVADAGSVPNFNQVSQGYSEYPEHMVFDPQYPGWYYDTIIQEWRSLDTYSSSMQQTFQSTDQQNLNCFSAAGINSNNHKTYDDGGKAHNQGFQGIGTSQQYGDWSGSYGNYNQQQSLNKWQPTVNKAQTVPGYSENQLLDNTYASNESVSHVMDQQNSFNSTGMVPLYNGASLGTDNANGNIRPQQQGFIFGGSFNQPLNQSKEPNEQYNYYGNQHAEMFSQQSLQSSQQFAYASNVGRSSAGRPPHALVHFGFGGKLITTKYTTTQSNMSYDNQDHMGGSIHVHNLLEVVTGKNEAPSFGRGACTYFHSLCQQSFPGPLVGGNAGTKDLNKWLDERIANCDSLDMDCGKGEHLRLLLSLLKIACQHYGKLRSPFGTDTSSREGENPESAVAKLFASAKKHGGQLNAHGAVAHCLQNFPPEGQMLATAAAMQSLLVSGRTREALQCAQEGQLWGPALVLAAQLGDQFYADTVKQMALHQLTAGSPLRTLCLLIAGQHADVFSMGAPVNHGYPVSANVAQQSGQVGVNVLLDDWEDNLAVVTANRTKDDELVIIHLGDCLWKERSEIVAAHICYIVAEANFEPCSDSARLCLIGADHWKFPRTFASPEAIQRTELYEYSKVLGNSQFILLPFQPYKLVYAHMLAEVGKVSDALKYCQAVLKSIKTGREPVVETWKQLVLSLEERLKGHQQGGFTTNLAPAKLVGKLFNLFDSTAHRVVGSFPPVPPASQTSAQDNGHPHEMMAPRVLSSHSTMAMSSLMPSTSMEPINEWTADGSRMARHNRSVSEPDFGRTPRQADSSKQEATSDAQGNKARGSGGPSRFGRLSFGSQLFQKTVGLVLKRPQAKLGEKNKFYYDEKLKRWVEEGVEPPSEEPALPPPPTTSSLNNGMSDYPSKNVLKTGNSPTGWSPEQANSAPHELSSGIPPIPPTSNQFSARGRTGVRSRYVDTFNQGNGAPVNLFQSPSAPSFKSVNAAANPKFFVPVPASPSPTESTPASMPDTTVNENPSTSDTLNSFHFSPAPSSPTIQRFPSMGNISDQGGPGAAATRHGPGPLSSHSRRTASWSGSISDSFSPPKSVGSKPLGAGPLVPMNGGVALGDELHEVEL